MKTYDAGIGDYKDTLRLLSVAGLAVGSNGIIALTAEGRRLLELNSMGSVELGQTQKEYLAETIVFSGHYRADAKRVFEAFLPDHDALTYRYQPSDERQLPADWRRALHLFQFLGILLKTNAGFAVSATYVKHVRKLRGQRKGLTQEELELRLDSDRKLGFKAEELIVEYERERLRKLGLIAEADRVKRISVLEPGAGYDVRSFDGSGAATDYDRFIEVKASAKAELGFYWTKNEMDVARVHGRAYWIYFLADFSQSRTLPDIQPLMLRNPYQTIMVEHTLAVESVLYRIEGKWPNNDEQHQNPA